MYSDCSIIVSSCDAYSDMWAPFFKCLFANWSELDMTIYLNTESKSFTYEDKDIVVLNNDLDVSHWGARYKKALQAIDTEYVLTFLDDFWLDSPVDVDLFERTLNYIRDNKNIMCFNFSSTSRPDNKCSVKFPEFEKRPKNGEYRLNTQAAIWRREKLIKCIPEHINPWEWEVKGNRLARWIIGSVYSIKKEIKSPFSYNYMVGGACSKGKWIYSVVEPLNNKYKLGINLNIRGYLDDEEGLLSQELIERYELT